MPDQGVMETSSQTMLEVFFLWRILETSVPDSHITLIWVSSLTSVP